ncbi:histidine kinase [Nonomuraea sp. NPDC049309]|uniref:ATP-binding protein n=1 Tax=Nonomuraea sp. NPDC049309 TaxID=3364350 RepID=UPI00370FD07E
MTIEHRLENTEAGPAASRTEDVRADDAASAWDAERHRIVRDLHDVVTHQVAAMIVQAEAARYLTGAPERLDAALTAVTDTGRRAIADLRYMLGLLPYGPGPVGASAGDTTTLANAPQNRNLTNPGRNQEMSEPGRDRKVPGSGRNQEITEAGRNQNNAAENQSAEAALIPPQPTAPDIMRAPRAAGPAGAGTPQAATPEATVPRMDTGGAPRPVGLGAAGAAQPRGSAAAEVSGPVDAGVAGLSQSGGSGMAGVARPRGFGAAGVLQSVGLDAAGVSPGRGGGLEIGAPGDGDLHALVEEMRLAGQPVEFAEAGRAAPSSRAAELVAYRVVQAALVDALRYAPGSRTSVEVRHGVREVTLRVRTDGVVFHAAAGRDLAGVRARVEALGGEFHQERRSDGAFVIRAVIPATLPE